MPDNRVIAGKYHLIAKLSKGGMGSVWRARHLELDCPAAVKLLDPTFAESPEALARFRREAQSAASLRSAHIVQILDFGVDKGTPYIAMELLRGQSLADLLASRAPLSPEQTALILSQVARAVGWAHSKGIIHRDLKPGNIFISEDADTSMVKLVDFGIAKQALAEPRDPQVTVTGAIMGTPQYMSPEQASGRGTVDSRTDIWSFGIVAFECLTGYHAFAADTLGSLLLAICTAPLPVPSAITPVPVGFDEWFARCAQRDPNHRFPTITQAADELRRICGLPAERSMRAIQVRREESPETLCSSSSDGIAAENDSSAGVPATQSSVTPLVANHGSRKRRSRYLILAGLFGTGAIGMFAWSAREPTLDRTPAQASQTSGVVSTWPVPSQASPAIGESSSPVVVLPNDLTGGTQTSVQARVINPREVSSPARRPRQAKPTTNRWNDDNSVPRLAASGERTPAVTAPIAESPVAEVTVESEFGLHRPLKQEGKP